VNGTQKIQLAGVGFLTVSLAFFVAAIYGNDWMILGFCAGLLTAISGFLLIEGAKQNEKVKVKQ
jgi:hypothetical protein